MAKKPAQRQLFSITPDKMEWVWNTDLNHKIRWGWSRAVAPKSLTTQSCLGISELDGHVISVWSDGKVELDASGTLGTLTATTPRWPSLQRVTVVAWSGTAWVERDVVIALTDTNNYIIDHTSPDGVNNLFALTPSATPAAPTGAPAPGGLIPAGTYRYMVTEVDYWGQESVAGTALVATSASNFSIVVTKGTTANSNIVFWRVYRSLISDVAGNETWLLAGQIAIATTTFTDNLVPTNLGLPYKTGRVNVPATASLVALHKFNVVYAGDSAAPNTLYFCDVTTSGSIYEKSGYPEVGLAAITIRLPEEENIVALQPLGEMLLVFTKQSVWVMHGQAGAADNRWEKLAGGVGTYNKRTVCEFKGHVYFLNSNFTNLYITDGSSVVCMNEMDMFEGVWFHLTNSTNPENKSAKGGQWSEPIVMADPEHNCIYVGGEICTAANAAAAITGVWTAGMKAANPWGNRQYVFRVFFPDARQWRNFHGIPIMSGGLVNGKVYFGSHQPYVESMNSFDVGDGTTTGLGIKQVVLQTSTNVQWAGAWTGSAEVGAPVYLIATDGTIRLYYAQSYSTGTVVVDISAVQATGDHLVIGLPITEYYTPPLDDNAVFEELEMIASELDRKLNIGTFQAYARQAPNEAWTLYGDWWPTFGTYTDKCFIGTEGRHQQARIICLGLYGSAVPLQAITRAGVEKLVLRLQNLTGE